MFWFLMLFISELILFRDLGIPRGLKVVAMNNRWEIEDPLSPFLVNLLMR